MNQLYKAVKFSRKWFVVALGSFLVAIGLELFLIPNQIIDGGVVGLSIIFSEITPLSLSIYLILINLPFLYLGYREIGKTFAISTMVAVALLAIFVRFFHHIEAATDNAFLATVFGGIVIGIGVGLIIRNGGSLDGTEILAIIGNEKLGFSVGEIVMFFNIFILGSAGFVFGWDRAMYSLIAYFIAFKVIDIVVEGLDESKSVMIISDKPDEIAEAILFRLGRGVTHIYGKGAYTQESKELLYCIVTRIEVAKLKSIVLEHDPNAFVAIEHVHDVLGGRFKKKSIH
ncbi:YitT family protein [Mechercharimyces sp. CAU 1602]|uniref:YitT family protein n=1 Tax=Mechercharimyces sp. CAU 1602 TaxID=2973933 RepID=UPI00216237D3|nr:YitT family protein [Mechercharimyces sp. CAU 1602]MCS1352034.1 YitT family protein [Mechercharimyces sp. CAU 1602]